LFILPLTLSGSATVWGVAAGACVEWMFNRRWSVKAEYEFLGFNKTVTGCGILPVGANGQNGTWCTQTSIGPVETGKVGVNYHF
jgi:outer membrane immunogenic protein